MVRTGRRALLGGVTALVCLGALLVTSAVGADRDAPEPVAARVDAPRSSGILTLDAGDIDATPGAWKGSWLVLQSWEYARIPALKAQNPRLRILMYKDVSATRKDSHETGLFSTGVSFREAAANDWLLTDGAGRPLEWSDWTGLYPADVGNNGYQRRWGDNVLAELRAHDWDGVLMDDTLTYLSHSTVGGRVSTQIPDDGAMYDATESFLARVDRRIQQAGFLAVPNLTVEWNTWRGVLEDWTPYVSGWENEYFVKWGLDRAGARFVGPDWQWKTDLAAWCADRDVPLLAVTYSNRDDVAAQLYHRATWLLTWNGRTGASIFVPEESDVDHWTSAATVEIGTPAERRHLVGNTGVWRRDYSGGTVLVNPGSQARQVRVGRGYERLGGRAVSGVRVPPLSGVILRLR
ncbi:MAG TPA: putative glycoside hydrolase [Nocardioides sp.]|nr:putative glycoside hydrolase [Nocardioides sp.]